MNVIVTGGAGFIGGNFINYMLSRYPEYRIICMDALTYAGNLNILEPLSSNPRFCFYEADISDKDKVFQIFQAEKPDILINFAAESHVDRSIEEPGIFLKTNVIGTQVLLDACRKYGIKRFHQISTDEVYGDIPLDCMDMSINEESPLRPSNPYSASKAAADLLALSYYRTYGLPITISRSCNNYGPYQHSEKLIPLIILNSLKDKSLPIYGKGENIRNWIYVEDHCTAIDLILQHGSLGQIYNISGHNEKTNLEVVRAILKELGKPESLITFVPDRIGHDRKYAIDTEKLRNELGWKSFIQFEEGINKTIQWYLDHSHGWKAFPESKL